jgi:hypothetical protein
MLLGISLGMSQPLAAQGPAVLVGSVLTDSTERPIANAEISIAALNLRVRSDSGGAFTLAGVPAGKHTVTVRAPGYAEFTTVIAFATSQRVEADLLLQVLSKSGSAQTLAAVDVKAARPSSSGDNPRIAEFDERRKFGLGKFLTQEVFEKAEGRKLAEVLIQRIPGLRTSGTTSRVLVASRGTISFKQLACPVQIIIDDIVQNSSNGAPTFDIDTIDPNRVAAVEFYTVANRPAQFNRGGAPCGTLVIWTRW